MTSTALCHPAPHVTRLAIFRLVMSNPRLRRAVIAFAAFNLADWARWLSVLIYAFTRGGAVEAGAVSLLQLLPAALVAPLAASLGDRFRRDRVLVASYVAQASFMVAAAAAILIGTPAPVVYGLAVCGACAITLTRPAHGALLPWLARTPAELTAANAVSGTMEGLGILTGQAAAGLVLQFTNPGIALLTAALAASIAAALARSVRMDSSAMVTDRLEQPSTRPAIREELLAGFGAVLRLRGPRTIVFLLGLAAFAWGALDVLIVVLAFDLLHIGATGVGVLNALAGAGGLAGAAIARSEERRVGKEC